MPDMTSMLQQQVNDAFSGRTPLSIQGNRSKQFLLPPQKHEVLHTGEHTGIIKYEPTELVMTVRAGTRIDEITRHLRKHRQITGFEPPGFAPTATIGGTLACNLSGPARPFRGAARDFVLGCRIINGRGEVLQFGGEVMKNVAGYDTSRLMAGAYGTLGVLLDISIRVLPEPESEQTMILKLEREEAIQRCTQLRQQACPVTAACHIGQQLYIRFSGNTQAVRQILNKTAGEIVDDADAFWVSIREQKHPFFSSTRPLWRVSVPPATRLPFPTSDSLLDWGGGLYWLFSDLPASQVIQTIQTAGGHATLFRNPGGETYRFTPLASPMKNLHQQLKRAFDPNHILNPDLFNQVF